MPLLAGFLGTVFGAILDFFMKYFTRRVAMLPAVVVAITALTATLYLAFMGLLSAVEVAMPPQLAAMTGIFPPNTTACMAAVSSARLLKWVYDWNNAFIQRTLL
jgi:hypothetical protein